MSRNGVRCLENPVVLMNACMVPILPELPKQWSILRQTEGPRTTHIPGRSLVGGRGSQTQKVRISVNALAKLPDYVKWLMDHTNSDWEYTLVSHQGSPKWKPIYTGKGWALSTNWDSKTGVHVKACMHVWGIWWRNNPKTGTRQTTVWFKLSSRHGSDSVTPMYVKGAGSRCYCGKNLETRCMDAWGRATKKTE